MNNNNDKQTTEHISPLSGEGQGGEASAAKHTTPPPSTGGGKGGGSRSGPPMVFAMPMFNDWVPKTIRPWIYCFIALTFQLSGARYLGALNELIGDQALMREDLLMCLYCNMMGMAIWFPMLFRMKFRFTNHTLLIASSITVIITNILSAYVTFLPLLWFICFIEGIAKIQGTFECMSNIQLWMTSKRDFNVFFPLLHVFLLTGIAGGICLSAVFAYYFADWRMMHYFIIALQLITLTIQLTLTHHFRFMKLPLVGIDWTSLVLLVALVLQLTYILDYGDWYSWYNHDTIWYLTGTTLITLGIFIMRVSRVRHPFINLRIFTRFRFVKRILFLCCIVEIVFGTEHVLEEVFLEEGLHYNTLTRGMLQIPCWIGNMCGCVFALCFLKKFMRMSYVRLGIIASTLLSAYLVIMYLIVSPSINIEMLYLPLFCRGFAFALFGVLFLCSMQAVTDFNHYFQCLCILNTIHMFLGGALGGALYAKGLGYYVAEGMARYGQYIDMVGFTQNHYHVVSSWFPDGMTMGQFMPEFVEQMLMYAVKNLYGWAAIVSVCLILGFMLFDSPIRRHWSYITPWNVVGDMLRKHLTREMSREEDPFAIPVKR